MKNKNEYAIINPFAAPIHICFQNSHQIDFVFLSMLENRNHECLTSLMQCPVLIDWYASVSRCLTATWRYSFFLHSSDWIIFLDKFNSLFKYGWLKINKISVCRFVLFVMAFQQEYFAIPPITRAYTTTCLLTTIAVVSEVFALFFSFAWNFHIIIPAGLIAQSVHSFLFDLNFETQLFRYNRIGEKKKKKKK